jgi:hypothetical protein
MLSSRIPSVKDTYFQHKVLTKIHGEPTYESLQNISTELKANASSVPSTLGGGQNGHLGLLLSAARCNTLAHAVPWITPVNPGVFVPPNPGTGLYRCMRAHRGQTVEVPFFLSMCSDPTVRVPIRRMPIVVTDRRSPIIATPTMSLA